MSYRIGLGVAWVLFQILFTIAWLFDLSFSRNGFVEWKERETLWKEEKREFRRSYVRTCLKHDVPIREIEKVLSQFPE